MKITHITTAVIEANYGTIVRVDTKEATSGIGEAPARRGLTATKQSCSTARS